jgi:single-strand DNA-binding protein
MADLKMPEINNVVIAGNLIHNPVFRTLQNGNSLLCFTIAANRRFRDGNNGWNRDVSFLGVIARNKLADSCYRKLRKGSGVLIEGELQSREMKSESGELQRLVEIKARRIQFLNKLEYVPKQDSGRDPVPARKTPYAHGPAGGGPGTRAAGTVPEQSDTYEDDGFDQPVTPEESEILRRHSTQSMKSKQSNKKGTP